MRAIAVAGVLVVTPAVARAVTYIVTTAADTPDDSATDGLCLDADGECSLRAAITEANRAAGSSTITFAIPGSWVIDLATALPAITKQVYIHGCGSSATVTTTHGVAVGMQLDPGSDASEV